MNQRLCRPTSLHLLTWPRWCCGATIATAAAWTSSTTLAPGQDKMEAPADVIAVQIRKQGYACEEAQSAIRDREASTPNATVWILRCRNASYRVRLTPDMAAQVERIE